MRVVLYPDINVSLVGEDGNAFAIMGRVSKAMRKAKVPASVVNEFTKEAMSGDYDNLLRTCMKYVSCDSCDEEEEDECYDCGEKEEDCCCEDEECCECGEWIDDCSCDEEE